MENQSTIRSAPNFKFGFYTALITTILTFVSFGIAIFTPPPAGPYCNMQKCYEYPYQDIASRFPRDYIWIYPSMLMCLAYLALMSFIHGYASEEKKVYTRIGFSFALISSLVLLMDYFIQVSVIQPSLLLGEADGVAMLSQFNPHGVFIALEELGYIMMGFSFLFVAPVFGGNRLENWIKWLFVGAPILTFLSFLAYSFAYGVFREYRFEVAAISINWLTLIASGILLSIMFRKKI